MTFSKIDRFFWKCFSNINLSHRALGMADLGAWGTVGKEIVRTFLFLNKRSLPGWMHTPGTQKALFLTILLYMHKHVCPLCVWCVHLPGKTLLLRKKAPTRSHVCHTLLIWRATGSPAPSASNGGSNFVLRHFDANMNTFELAELHQILDNLKMPNSWECSESVKSWIKSDEYGPKVSENKGWLTIHWMC